MGTPVGGVAAHQQQGQEGAEEECCPAPFVGVHRIQGPSLRQQVEADDGGQSHWCGAGATHAVIVAADDQAAGAENHRHQKRHLDGRWAQGRSRKVRHPCCRYPQSSGQWEDQHQAEGTAPPQWRG